MSKNAIQQMFRNPDRSKVRVIAGTAVFAVFLGIIIGLAFNIRTLLSTMERTGLDNSQWVIIQTEVEVLRLRHAIAIARIDGLAEADLNRWFYVLYSRVALLAESPVYRDFVQSPQNAPRLAKLQAFVNDWLPQIEGPQAALVAALPRMQAEAVTLQSAARGLTATAWQDMTQTTDKTRAGLNVALTRLALTTAATFTLLGLLFVMLMRVSATARYQGRENRLTGARLEVIIATSPDAIVVTNRSGRVIEFNPAAEAMFGKTRAQILGHEATQSLFAPEHLAAYRAVLTEALSRVATRDAERLELEGVRNDGSRFPLEVSFAVRDLSRDGLIVAFMRDISASKAADGVVLDALEKARAGERAKARFIAVMSHEMRTPLNGLLGSMGLMRDTGLTPDQVELLRVMQLSGEVLLDHVNSVLDLTVAEAGVSRPAVQPFDLDRVIADCVAGQAGLARMAGTTLSQVALDGPFGHVLGDAGLVRQVLLNLIGNAVKFTQNGAITVETERLPPNPDGPDQGQVEVRVIDTGIGIAAEDIDRVFQDFETVSTSVIMHRAGTGLGLGIARHLVGTMGGLIGAESDLGVGSVFWVRLPLPAAGQTLGHAAPAHTALPVSAPVKEPVQILSILIIEDNQINRFVLRRHLEAQGHVVTEAVDGLDGVARADRQAFDLIVTDMAMPQVDGLTAARRIRSGGGASANARIILLTAYTGPASQAQLDAAGIEACLIKPVSRTDLVALVAGHDVIGQPPRTDAPLLDPGPLTEMRAALGAATVHGLVARMMDDGDATLAHLARTPDPGQLLHHLAGGCALFGAVRMRLCLIKAEHDITSGPPATAQAAVAALYPLWADTRAALAAHASQTVAGDSSAAPAKAPEP